MKNHFFSFIIPFFLLNFLNASNKIHRSQVEGGSLQSTTIASNTISKPDRKRHVPYKYKHQRGVPLAQMYRGSSHEKALDAQIASYESKALKNLLVFGGYSKRWLYESDFNTMVSDISSPRDLKNEFLNLVEKGDLKISYKTIGAKWPIKIDIVENYSK